MQSAALVASFTAVSMRIASSGSISMACGTRSTPLVPGIRMGSSSSTTRICTGPATSATDFLLNGSPSLTCYEGDLHRPREQARAVGASEQLGYGPSAGRSVVHRIGVDVHPDEPINASLVEAAAVRRRVREGLGPMREAVLNAGLEVAGDGPHQCVSQVATHDVAAERQRQARLVIPPFAEIDPEVQ